MIAWMNRVGNLTLFLLDDYRRSWKFLVELAGLVIVIWVFFWPRSTRGLEGEQFFTITGIFLLVQSAYTCGVFAMSGRNPRALLFLTRKVGKDGFMASLFAASLAMSTTVFAILTTCVFLLNWVMGQQILMTPGGWVRGTLPLALNVAMIQAFVLLVSPSVLPAWPRIAILGFLAVTATPDLRHVASQPALEVLMNVLYGLGALLLTPLLSGLSLSISMRYGDGSLSILLWQGIDAALLLGTALAIFSRREFAVRG